MGNKIQFGSKEIYFSLEYANRKTLGIAVHPDLSVRVVAPTGTSLDKIHEKVKKRAHWILKQQRYFLAFEPRTPPRKYISGETHFYLGRQYRLKVIQDQEERVRLKNGFLVVSVAENDHSQRVKHLLNQWYEAHARERFSQYAAPWIEKFQKLQVKPECIEIKPLAKRWGSCTPKGKIILNLELIKAPKGCIEYVIVHELCHLVHANHSSAFFDLQTKMMPDWERWKERLESFMA